MKTMFGFIKTEDGITVNKEAANTINLIAELYLQGFSLGSISNTLEDKGYLSPSGKTKWSRSVIDSILSNSLYVPCILSEELFYEIQFVKEKRSNKNNDNSRKATRYNSKNVLSGLLFCEECGAPYRRITKSSGEVVWRCANRVESGKRFGHSAPTISEEIIKSHIIMACSLIQWDECIVREKIERINVTSNRNLIIFNHT